MSVLDAPLQYADDGDSDVPRRTAAVGPYAVTLVWSSAKQGIVWNWSAVNSPFNDSERAYTTFALADVAVRDAIREHLVASGLVP